MKKAQHTGAPKTASKKRSSAPSFMSLGPKMFVLGALLAVLVFSIQHKPSASVADDTRTELASADTSVLRGGIEDEILPNDEPRIPEVREEFRETVPVGEISPVIYGGRNIPIVYDKNDSSAQLIAPVDAPLKNEIPPPPPMFNEKAFQLQVEEKLQHARVEDMKSKVKFIAGLIAVHRPSIPDCGLVAREIVELSSERSIDPFFVAAIISIESRFGQHERSNVGAMGLMQLMPGTAAGIAPGVGGRITDVSMNIKLGIEYFQELEQRYNGNRALALAAYNWGPGNVDRVGRNARRFPSSVARYARTILERHYNWSNHYRKAKEGASAIELG